ncbi:MAG: ATP-grasp domain-containing protein [Flavobacteriaceae bacterium]|nr:ATP-grasp domain-containing protein [Flavobacteriaceae bacterium]
MNILIPDGEAAFTLSVIRCLSEYQHIKIFIIYTSRENIESKFSKFVYESIFFNKTENEEDFVKFVKAEIQKNKIDVLIPLHFYAFRLFSKHKAELEDILLNLPVTSVEKLELVNNKYDLSEFLEQQDLPCPRTYREVSDCEDSPIFPLLFKPLDGIGGKGIRSIENKKDLDDAFHNNEKGRFIIQEFVKGYDIDCSVLSKEGRILAFTMQKGFISSKIPFAPPDGVEFLNEPKLFNVIEKLIQTLNWTGVMHIDLRYDESDGNYKIIDINPRFWASVRASCKVGVNFPLLFCLSSLNIPYNQPAFEYKKYANLNGLRKIIVSKLKLRNMLEMPENSPIKDDICDPKPLLYHIYQKIENKIKSSDRNNREIQNNSQL